MDRYQVSPLVTIIIPIYNVKSYLEECVNSVLAQTYHNLEIILVDDGSTDGSGEMCDSFAKNDSRICVIHKPNGGQGSARNAGIAEAHGKYFVFLDSDDWITEDTIDYLVKKAEGNNLDLLLFAARSFIDGKKEDLNHVFMGQYSHTQCTYKVMDGLTAYRQMENVGEYHTSICMRFYLRQYWLESRFQFLETIIREDEDIGFLSLISAKRVEVVDKRFYQRRYRPGSTMTSMTNLRSVQGFAGVFESLVKKYCSVQPTGVLRETYIKRIEEYLGAAANQYCQADKKEQKQIRMAAQPHLKSGLKAGIPVRRSLRIAEESLLLYDLLRSLKRAIMRRLIGI